LSDIRASIDIGSNSVLLLVASVTDGKINEIANEARITGLGRGIDKTGLFSRVAVEETFQALKEYAQIARESGVNPSKIITTATEASRVVKNSLEFFEKVKQELGINVQVISSEAEAFYTSYGVSLCSGEKEAVVMDIGGASTELIKVNLNPFEVCESISIPLGSVRATDFYLEGSLENKFNEVIKDFNFVPFKTEKLICVAGSMTSIAAMIKGMASYSDKEVDGYDFSLELLQDLLKRFFDSDPSKLLNTFPFLGKRSKTILSGARVGIFISQRLGVKRLKISTYGLRYGTLINGGIDGRF